MSISTETKSEILALVVKECLKTPEGRATLKAGWEKFADQYSNSPAGMKLKDQRKHDFWNDVSRYLELNDVFELKYFLGITTP